MRYIPLLLLCLLLQACTQTQKGLVDTVSLALLGPEDVQISSAQIEALPYASIYLRLNGGQRIFVVLGFDEEGQQKWITQDRSVVVTQHGRVVKTLGLRDNLKEVTNLQQDPLADPRRLTDGASWTRTLSWTENGHFRAGTAVSHFTRLEDRMLDIAGSKIACQVWQEKVELAGDGRSWTNTFWTDAATGLVRQSQQTPGGENLSFDITLLKPAKS
ncbi:YjbF family lipoprotein [Pantoea sp. FN060301]|uniref:YjbF family lipoprotein n=1 Tax=Pantoea sp. FN060301 TaxID=3420380 RepID=UPI003D17CCDB